MIWAVLGVIWSKKAKKWLNLAKDGALEPVLSHNYACKTPKNTNSTRIFPTEAGSFEKNGLNGVFGKTQKNGPNGANSVKENEGWVVSEVLVE